MESFDALALQYNPMIHKIIHSLHIVKNEDEFYQIGLIALWEATQGFSPAKGSFTSYAYSMIRGKLLIEINKSRKLNERMVFPKEEFWDALDNSTVGRGLEREILLTYCQELTEKEAAWVTACFYDTLTTKEIAKKHNVTESAVKQWKSNALKKLRHCLVENPVQS